MIEIRFTIPEFVWFLFVYAVVAPFIFGFSSAAAKDFLSWRERRKGRRL